MPRKQNTPKARETGDDLRILKTPSQNRNDDTAAIDAHLAEIAKRLLRVPTLASRGVDALDFHELSVGQIQLALRAAYEAGRRSMK